MKILRYGLPILAVLAASIIIYVAHIGYHGFSINHQIDPIEVVALAFGVLVAVLFQYYLANRMSNRRAEKDLLLEDVRDSMTMLRSCREVLYATYASGKIGTHNKSILQQFRQLSNSLDTIEMALEMSECKSFTSDLAPVRAEYLNYKAAATRAPFPSRPYSANDIAEQERTYQKLRKQLQSLLFKINKSE